MSIETTKPRRLLFIRFFSSRKTNQSPPRAVDMGGNQSTRAKQYEVVTEYVVPKNDAIGLDVSLFGTTWATLRGIHVATCALHIGGVVTAVVFLARGEDWSIPVVTSFADWRRRDPTIEGCRDENCFVTPAHRRLGDWRISLQGLVVAFHALSFAWQFAVLVDECGGRGGIRARYLSELRKGRNGFRWFEYALSAPLMTIILAVVFGIVDFYVLLALAVCTSGLQFFGYVQEIFLSLRNRINDWFVVRSPILAGFFFWVAYWTVIGTAFHQSITASQATPNSDMTLVIWMTFIVMTVMYVSFAGVLAYDVSRRANGIKMNYANVEGVYCILSLFSKWALGALLAWTVSVRSSVIGLGFVVDPPCGGVFGGYNGTNVTNATIAPS